MDTNLSHHESSEEEYAHRLAHMARAGAGIIHVRTDELWRTVLATRKTVIAAMRSNYNEWDIMSGTKSMTVTEMYNIGDDTGGGEQLGDVLRDIIKIATDPDNVNNEVLTFYTIINPHFWWDSPIILQMLQQSLTLLPASSCRLVLVTPDMAHPAAIGDGVGTITMKAPSFTELQDLSNSLIDMAKSEVDLVGIDAEDLRDVCNAGMGMSRDAFELALSMGIADSKRDTETEKTVEALTQSVSMGKTEVLNQSELLELYPQESMVNVGGMENLKTWVAKRAGCYSDAAREHGVEPPKGCVVVGPPGTGKSLVAKAVSKELGVSLVRLDFGKVFNSLVGASEERIRKALADVASMAPCVLFVDEIDKGLGGIGQGGGDSGTSSRVLGSFLTWLNDNTSPVFTMVTANNIDALPPELMRRGRFDQIFSTGLPTTDERLDILNIHLSKRGWGDEFKAPVLQRIAKSMKGFVGAEVESVVKDALVDSFSEGSQLTEAYLIQAKDNVIPLSVAYSEQIQKMTLWAKTNAIPAGTSTEETTVTPIRSRRRKAEVQE